MKLQVLAEKIYPVSQCEFREKWVTIDMIFSLRQLESFLYTPKICFWESTEGIYLWAKWVGNLFKLSRLRVKTKVHEKYVHDFRCADDAAITTHTQEDLQRLLDRFSDACRHFGINLAQTQSWGKTLRKHHRSSSSTTNWRSFMSLCTWGLPSQTTSPSTVSSINELEWLPRHSLRSQNVYGSTTGWQNIPKSMYIKPL